VTIKSYQSDLNQKTFHLRRFLSERFSAPKQSNNQPHKPQTRHGKNRFS
jgi:hypothetical protein